VRNIIIFFLYKILKKLVFGVYQPSQMYANKAGAYLWVLLL